MKMKTIAASLAACAIAVSAMAFSASAALISRTSSDTQDVTYTVPIADYDLTQLDKIVVDVTVDSKNCQGSINYNNINGVWMTNRTDTSDKETDAWTVEDIGGIQGSLEVRITYVAEIAAADETEANKPGTANIDAVKLYDKNGQELQKKTTTTASSTTTTTQGGGKGDTQPAAKTGDAGAGVAVSALGVAAAAAYIARRKH